MDDPNLQDIEGFSIFRGLKAEEPGGGDGEDGSRSPGVEAPRLGVDPAARPLVGVGLREDPPGFPGADTPGSAGPTAPGGGGATPELLHSSQESLLNLNDDSVSSMDIDIGVLEKVRRLDYDPSF